MKTVTNSNFWMLRDKHFLIPGPAECAELFFALGWDETPRRAIKFTEGEKERTGEKEGERENKDHNGRNRAMYIKMHGH